MINDPQDPHTSGRRSRGYGAMLARAGHAVTLVARAPHVAAIRARGLQLQMGGEVHPVPLTATTELDAVRGADLVLFPEATMCRFGVPLAPVAQPLDGPWADAIRDIAKRSGVTVVAGMFCPSADGRVTNTLIATGPNLEAHYHKMHLYDAFGYRESASVAPGNDALVADLLASGRGGPPR